MTAPKVGDAAPAFELPDQHGRIHRLGDYRGHWVVLYFYPKDDTPGCTTEACAFRDASGALHDLHAIVLGISRDAAPAHARFADKYGLNFPLLCDTDGTTAAAYGALWRLGPLKIVRRHSFLIDPNGTVARVYRSVDPQHHGEEILAALRGLSKSSPSGRKRPPS